MTAASLILIIDDDAKSRQFLEKALCAKDDYHDMCVLKAPGLFDQGEDSLPPAQNWIVLGERGEFTALKESQIFARPVRLGAVLDRIAQLASQSEPDTHANQISIGPWMLDVVHSSLHDVDGGEKIRLTDKERDILQVLHKHTGQSVSREALLQEVWGYVDGVETHTLETHIYRLRQKIEKDPAQPDILLTNDEGYFLKLI